MENTAIKCVALQLVVNRNYNLGNELVEMMDLFDDSSSEDEENEIVSSVLTAASMVPVEKTTKPLRITNYIERVVHGYTNTQFQQSFRVSRMAYEFLLQNLSPMLSSPIGKKPMVQVDIQLMAVLWLLATPECYRSVGERFGLAKSSLYVSFERVIMALNKIAATIITWPTGERLQSVKNGFKKTKNMDGVIGAVDGTYCPIKAPREHAQSYTNRKCFTAITLQAICDHNMVYTDCFVGYPSSVHDSRIFKNSPIYRNIVQSKEEYFPNDEFIIGDKAYPLFSWVIPPYINRGRMTEMKKKFNHHHASTRQVIERSFALLFGRFRRLRYLDMNRIDLIPPTILAACVLHNVCLLFNDDCVDAYINDATTNPMRIPASPVSPNEEENSVSEWAREGVLKRDGIASNM